MPVRALGRPIPLPLGNYTGSCVIGAQRGVQRALGVHAPPWVGARIRTRARDSTHSRVCREALSVLRIMCLVSECVSKATNWWECPIVSIWRGRGFRPWGPIVGIAGKDSDKYRYDILVGRPSTYRGIFERGILARARGEINVTCVAGRRRRNRMLSTTGRGTRV